jgi:CCR4-NOT transcription complex subunit 4
VRKNRERKQKEKQEKKVTDRPALVKPIVQTVADRRHLHNYRVVQRNLVYVIGLPAVLSSEDLLRKAEYFGQYGKIGKVVIHRNHSATHATISAYVTFAYKEDAKASIQSLEGHWVEGHLLRASFGTTKYCNNFIRGMPCNNPDCVYLHELGEDEDRFTKEEIQAGHSKLVHVPGSHQTIVTGNGGPSGSGKRYLFQNRLFFYFFSFFSTLFIFVSLCSY